MQLLGETKPRCIKHQLYSNMLSNHKIELIAYEQYDIFFPTESFFALKS